MGLKEAVKRRKKEQAENTQISRQMTDQQVFRLQKKKDGDAGKNRDRKAVTHVGGKYYFT